MPSPGSSGSCVSEELDASDELEAELDELLVLLLEEPLEAGFEGVLAELLGPDGDAGDSPPPPPQPVRSAAASTTAVTPHKKSFFKRIRATPLLCKILKV